MLLRPLASILAQPWQVQVLGVSMAVFSTVLPVWFVTVAMRSFSPAGIQLMVPSFSQPLQTSSWSSPPPRNMTSGKTS
jgi:hypothetical protein